MRYVVGVPESAPGVWADLCRANDILAGAIDADLKEGAMSPDQAKRIGRGRTIALSYAAMTGLSLDADGLDTAVVDCIADLLHAAVAEPFARAGLGAADKIQIAEGLVAEAMVRHFEAELREVDAE